MALNLKYSAVLANAQQNAITSTVGASATLKFYDGTQPASPDTAVSTQNLLATLTCNATFAPAASGKVLTLNSITGANASATGTATWFRISTSGGTAHVDGSVGASGCDINLISASMTSGQPVSITSETLTNGN